MNETGILINIVSIITILLGLWLFVVLIPSVINSFHEIMKEVRISTLKHKLYKLNQYTQTADYDLLTNDEKKEIHDTIETLDSILHDILAVGLTAEDIELSLQIKDAIEDIVLVEVNRHVHDNYVIMGEKYDILKLDTDVKKISTKVFHAINTDMFDLNLLFSKDYMISHIIDITKTNLLAMVTKYNENLTN